MSTEIVKNSKYFYNCKTCHYNTCKLHHYNQHLLTAKHKNQQNVNKINILSTEIMPLHFQCHCGRKYKERSGLWRHKKKCEIVSQPEETEISSPVKNIETLLMQDRQELKLMMMEIIKNQSSTIIHNTNNSNSHNKTFNLQVFLNDTCKNAMNIMDFVENVKINLSDLENVGKLGYVDGITNIIVNNLKDLDISKRPVHCSDLKREILYIKDDNKWTKENEEKDKLRNAIKHIAHKND